MNDFGIGDVLMKKMEEIYTENSWKVDIVPTQVKSLFVSICILFHYEVDTFFFDTAITEMYSNKNGDISSYMSYEDFYNFMAGGLC